MKSYSSSLVDCDLCPTRAVVWLPLWFAWAFVMQLTLVGGSKTNHTGFTFPFRKFIDKHIGPVKQKFQRKIAIIFLSISFNMCFGCSKEPSQLVPTTYVLIEK